MEIWTLARKDLRLLLRDARAMVILLAMPLIFIVVLGVTVGEDFGKHDKLRVSILNLDKGLEIGAGPKTFFVKSWSAMVLKDLTETSDIHVELIKDLEEADQLIKNGRRAAILVLGRDFSKRIERCSFLADGINPFFRDGVDIENLDAKLLKDDSQLMSAAIVEQATQGTLLRIILPWMIGRAFEKIGDPDFLTLLGKEKDLPFAVKLFLSNSSTAQKKDLGAGLQNALQQLFPRYNLTAKTWASLTKESEHSGDGSDKTSQFKEEGEGWLKRGAARYQNLVPSNLVMFAFFLVLTVGWLFVAERRQGTLVRLRAAPIARWQILLGKLLPCYLVSLFQGLFLLLAGNLIFKMPLGPDPAWLVPLVFATSFAAMGLALLVASLARTETQVAVYGTLLVLVLAGLSGALMGDLSQIPEPLQYVRLFTPHAWALDAYRLLLATPSDVDLGKVAECCGVLALFGVGFVGLSWWWLRLE
jgi:ABC-2 type transport system permease protein